MLVQLTVELVLTYMMKCGPCPLLQSLGIRNGINCLLLFLPLKRLKTTHLAESVVFSEHKPSESFRKKPLHHAPKCFQGIIILLQKYDLVVKYEKGNRMFLADTLSRAFLPAGEQDVLEFETINMISICWCWKEDSCRYSEILIKAGKPLQVLKAVIQKGWPENKSNQRSIISPYLNMRDDMSIQHGLTIKGGQVVVPSVSRR